MRFFIVVVLYTAGCSISVNHDGTRFRCEGVDGACPADHACREGFCEYAPACSIAAATGDDHTCAVRDDRTVWCWGRNDAGQLGDGTTTDANTPVQVAGIDTAIAVATGSRHTCALLAEGEVQCWGGNPLGQLGNDSELDSSSPVAVKRLTGIEEIAAGHDHTCARKGDDGTVWCWGANHRDQLGTANEQQYQPEVVAGIVATRIWAGVDSTCALTGAALQCWGSNEDGLLGVGDIVDAPSPRTVPLSDVTSVAISNRHMCVVGRKAGDARQVWCSGFNEGRLGNGMVINSTEPVAAELPPDEVSSVIPIIEEVAVGEVHSCARADTGRVWCWGANHFAQLGNGSGKYNDGFDKSLDQLKPVLTQFADAQSITANRHHTCIRDRRGGMWCAGHNGSGQRGNGERTSQITPRHVPIVRDAVNIATGGMFTCSVDGTNNVLCWGFDAATGKRIVEPAPVRGLPPGAAIGQLVAGESHACAIVDAEVWCWGNNEYGQLGDGVIQPGTQIGVSRSDAKRVDELGGEPVALAAGRRHTCALLAAAPDTERPVRCWGDDANGQSSGSNNAGPQWMPIAPTRGGVPITAMAITAGQYHACGTRRDGTATCWGDDLYGQLGDGDATDGGVRTGPAAGDPRLSVITQFAAQGRRSYALINKDMDPESETVAMWGECAGAVGDQQRQCASVGNNTPVIYTAAIEFGGSFEEIDTGDDLACARLGSAISCWGANDLGQLGNGTYTDAPEPTPVAGLSPFTHFAVGGQHACVITNEKTVECWGSNVHGQLGDGAADHRSPTGVRLVCGD